MECMRQAFCCAAGLHPIRVNWIDPDDDDVDFWGEWEREFERCGFRLQRTTIARAEASGLFWIAGVPSLRRRSRSHAIVMRGAKLHYDSNLACAPQYARRQRPKKHVANPIIPVPLNA